jgi:hypothetical protein
LSSSDAICGVDVIIGCSDISRSCSVGVDASSDLMGVTEGRGAASVSIFGEWSMGVPRGRMENQGRSVEWVWWPPYNEGTFRFASFGVMVTDPFRMTWQKR